MQTEQERTFTIGHFELVMVNGHRGFHGHYTNTKTGIINTFQAEGMTQKQILRKFWDRVNKEKSF